MTIISITGVISRKSVFFVDFKSFDFSFLSKNRCISANYHWYITKYGYCNEKTQNFEEMKIVIFGHSIQKPCNFDSNSAIKCKYFIIVFNKICTFYFDYICMNRFVYIWIFTVLCIIEFLLLDFAVSQQHHTLCLPWFAWFAMEFISQYIPIWCKNTQ